MTEEEAKTKWCHHQSQQMIGYQKLVAIGRIDYTEQKLDCNCIASGCMMWLWHSTDVDGTPTQGECELKVKLWI